MNKPRWSVLRAEADAFGGLPLSFHSVAALTRARGSLRRTLKVGLCPDTPERRAEYAGAIQALSNELGRR